MQQKPASATTAELARLGELIDSIYQAATDPSHWNTVVPQVVEWVGAPRGVLFTPLNSSDNGGYYFSHLVTETMMQLYGTRYQSDDVWTGRAVACGLMQDGAVIIGDDIVSFEELSHTVIYQELFSKYDTAHLLGGVIFGASSVDTPASAIALHRGLKEGRFHSHEGERLAILMPHLSRSLGVMTRLRDSEFKAAASLAALDRLNAGVVLFDARGAASFANRAARRIVEEADGLSLRHLTGRSALGELAAEDRSTQDALSVAIRSAISPDILHTAHFSRAVSVPRSSGRQAYTLNFSSLAAYNEFGAGSDVPRAIAFITDSSEPIRLDAEVMKKTFGLTPGEIRVAEMLAECLTVDETADRLCISRGTVKAHQQSIYEKTGTNNRAKLMKLLMALAQVAH